MTAVSDARRALIAIRLEIPGAVADDFIPIMEEVIARASAAEAEDATLRAQVAEYLAECDSPAPDYPYRAALRDALRRALADRPARQPGRCGAS